MIRNWPKYFVLSLLLLPPFAFRARAQEVIKPEKRALIKELYEVTKLDKTMQSFMDIFLAQMQNELPQIVSQAAGDMSGAADKDRDEIQRMVAESSARLVKRFREVVGQKINFAEVGEQLFYPIYDKFYTEEDLRALTAFYKSPVGQKSLEIMPQLMAESMKKSSEILLPRIMKIATEIMEEEKQRLNEEFKKRKKQ
ncbi:MAG: DUF2059 domain-containing protein [Blastocatellia bacterium]